MAMAERAGNAADPDRSAVAIAILRRRFGERLQTGEALRRQHANTLTWIPNQPPDAVIWVETTEEVREVVGIAATHGTPIIPFGGNLTRRPHQCASRRNIA